MPALFCTICKVAFSQQRPKAPGNEPSGKMTRAPTIRSSRGKAGRKGDSGGFSQLLSVSSGPVNPTALESG